MTFRQFVIAALILGSGYRLHAEAFEQLHFSAGQDTLSGSYRLRLDGPDNPQAPTLWEGPMSISTTAGACQPRVSLITAIWADPRMPLFIVVADSGSSTYVHFIDPGSCSSKWPPIKAFTKGVRIVSDRLEILPGCTCDSAKAPCFCSAAQVYGLQQATRPSFLSDRSRALTKQELGVAFSGMRRVSHPKTKSARLLPD